MLSCVGVLFLVQKVLKLCLPQWKVTIDNWFNILCHGIGWRYIPIIYCFVCACIWPWPCGYTMSPQACPALSAWGQLEWLSIWPDSDCVGSIAVIVLPEGQALRWKLIAACNISRLLHLVNSIIIVYWNDQQSRQSASWEWREVF